MDTAQFWQEVEKIAEELNIAKHPLVELVHKGEATREQLKQFAIEHYHMTVKDAGTLTAQGYISMRTLDQEGAELMAENFAEEAKGLYTHTAGHEALLFEFWEKGLGLPRAELEESSPSAAARTLNAYLWTMMSRKPKCMGAAGILEGGFSQACEKMFAGLQTHYGMSADTLRFFSGHIEADREHAQTGRKLINRLLIAERERQEFLREARCVAELYWKGWDAML